MKMKKIDRKNFDFFIHFPLGRANSHMKSDKFGCQRLHEIARGALIGLPFGYVGESEDAARRVGKLLERR